MSNNSKDFVSLYTPVTSEVLFDEYARRPSEYDRIYNVFNSSRQFETDSQLEGFGAMPLKAEGAAISYDTMAEGYQTTYTHASYGMGFRFTKEAQQDDLSDKLMKAPKQLGTSAFNTVETNGADLFNSGFTSVTGGDGKALFSLTHPSKSGQTSLNNTLAIQADLSATSLKDALVDFEDTLDARGLPLLQNAQTLVIPNNLRWTAQELLKSRQKPGSADNDFNPLSEADLSWMVYHYLTDDDAWFLVGDIHYMKFFWRQKLAYDSTHDFDSGDAKFKATMRFSYGHSDWRGVYGVSGQ